MQFSEINTSSVRCPDFPQVKSAIGGGCEAQTIQIDDSKAFATSGDAALTVGNITLRLQGTLTIGCDCTWSFSGTLKSYNDRYDFNASSHRSAIGEALTTFGRNIPGVDFDINILGSKSISESGKVGGGK
jgi:hypothetical protein